MKRRRTQTVAQPAIACRRRVRTRQELTKHVDVKQNLKPPAAAARFNMGELSAATGINPNTPTDYLDPDLVDWDLVETDLVDSDNDRKTENEEYYAIQTGFNSICPDPIMREVINKNVGLLTRLAFESSKLLHLHFHRLVSSNQPMPTRVDQTFFRWAIFSVSVLDSKSKVPAVADSRVEPSRMKDFQQLQTSAKLYYGIRKQALPSEKYANRNMIASLIEMLCAQMVTDHENHIAVNFERRSKAFFLGHIRRILLGRRTSNYKRQSLAQRMVWALSSGKELESTITDDFEKKEWNSILDVLKNSRKFFSKELLPATDKRIRKNWWRYLPWFHFLVQQLGVAAEIDEQKPRQESRAKPGKRPTVGKQFALLPDRGFVPIHIDITPTTLARCLLRMHPKHSKSKVQSTKMTNDKQQVFNLAFMLNNKTIHNYKKRKFGFLIRTDGVRCSVMFLRERSHIEHDLVAHGAVKAPDKSRIVGVDPGVRDLFVAVIEEHGKNNEIVRCSSKEYYHRCGFTKARRQREMWLSHAGLEQMQSNIASNKTSNIDQIKLHVFHALKAMNHLLSHYGEIRHRQLDWKCIRKKQQPMDMICKRIAGKTSKERANTTVGFGDGQFAQAKIRGHARGPTKSLLQQLRRYCHVRMVCEYKTSQLCSVCESQMTQKIRSARENGAKRSLHSEIYGVKVCSTCPNGLHWNRDVNAARNILKLYRDGYTFRGEIVPPRFNLKDLISLRSVNNDESILPKANISL